MAHRNIFLSLLVFQLASVSTNDESNTIVIDTKLGKIKGNQRFIFGSNNDTILTFYNIPYAIPPTKELRFSKPVPYGNWHGVRDATRQGKRCIQPSASKDVMSEDCLQLNIYVPRIQAKLKSVMVWVHGGGYVIGSGLEYDGTMLAIKGDVVVVTINYRLGVFGFLSLSNSIIKGNYGIWDQILALKWIKENIESFGGDPNSITIFGQSAGGCSVSLLALIPQTRYLFHRVIAQSGVAISPMSLGNSKEESILVGRLVGCSDYLTSAVFLRCMRSVGSSDILLKMLFFYKYYGSQSLKASQKNYFKPSIDGELFTGYPINAVQGMSLESYNFFSSLDFMTGICQNEGSLFFEMIPFRVQSMYNISVFSGLSYNLFCKNFIPVCMQNYYNIDVPSVWEQICKAYTDTSSVALHGTNSVGRHGQQQGVVDFVSDLLFVIPTAVALEVHRTNGYHSNTFQYVFTKESPYSKIKGPSWYNGPGHGDEIPYIFQPIIERNTNYTLDDNISDMMIAYWTNFAKFGDPNGPNLPEWERFENKNKSFLEIGKEIRTKTHYRKPFVQLWKENVFLLKNDRFDETMETIADRFDETMETNAGNTVYVMLRSTVVKICVSFLMFLLI